MRLVPIECVKEGSLLAKPLYDDEGRILLKEGIRLTSTIIKRISSIKIYSVYIIDEYSNKEIEDVIKPDLRQKAIAKLKETFLNIEKFIPSVSNNTLPSKAQLNTFLRERQAIFDNILSVANSLMEEILSKKNILVNLVDIKSMDNYTYQHCVNVAILSLILGIRLNLNKNELRDLCIGALIHDIGKILTPKSILLKEGGLTDSELAIMREHTIKGYEYVKNIPEIPATSRVITIQHHERYDGSGYPHHKKGKNIHKFSRIVAIADVYDALTSDRPYRRALSPSEALEYIMAGGSSQFDFDMVKTFAQIIVPYPEGTLVLLSTGEFAVVEEIYQNYPLRPKVKVVKSNITDRINATVNLVESIDIVIKDYAYNID
ncbi:MAG: HD-GYP domain-containing protein [Clostridiales bacterium]|nr:HD-GYP domain-containing protein [Clostridiales bacterium]